MRPDSCRGTHRERDDLLERRGLELDGARSGSATTPTRRPAGSARSRCPSPRRHTPGPISIPRSRATWSPSTCRDGTSPARFSSARTSSSRRAATSGSEYFMGHLAVSGVTGNINRGRLVNDERARTLAEQAVRFVAGLAGEPAHGLLTVDLREDRSGALKVTEINVRHVAATSAPRRRRREHGRGAGARDARPAGRDRRDRAAFPRRQRDPPRHRRRAALAHRLPRARGRGART